MAEQVVDYGKFPPFMLSVPIDITLLSKVIQGAGKQGVAEFPVFRVTFLAPAGVVTTFFFPAPAGFYTTMVAPFKVSSDFYDPNLITMVYVDDTKLITPLGYAITGPGEIELGEWYVVQRNFIGIVTNATLTDAVITLEVQTASFEKGFWENWVRKVLEHTWKIMNDTAIAMGGRKY